MFHGETKSGANSMTPKVGEVYVVDLGVEGKVRPVVVVSREDTDAPVLYLWLSR